MALNVLKTKRNEANKLENIVKGLIISQTEAESPPYQTFSQQFGEYMHERDENFPDNFYESLDYNTVLNEAKLTYNMSISEYLTEVKENFDEALNSVDSENLTKIAINLKPNTDNEEYKEIAKKHEKFIKLYQAHQNQDPSVFFEMIEDDFIRQRLGYLSQRQGGMQAIIGAVGSMAQNAQREFLESFNKSDGKIDEEKLREYVNLNSKDGEEYDSRVLKLIGDSIE
jgi:hypothetical protein